MAVNNTRQRVAYGLTDALLTVNPRPIISQRAPGFADKSELGQIWIDVPNNIAYILTSVVANSSTWVNLASGTQTLGASINGAMSVIGANLYIAPFGGESTDPAGVQFVASSAGTISKLYVNIDANTSTIGVTVTVNKNSVNTALAVTIPALTAGTFSDLVDSVTVAAGDLLQFEASASTGGTIQNGSVSVTFVPS